MRILMISGEVAPFAKTGGLADAVAALSRELARAGHDVRIVMPLYASVDRSKLEASGRRAEAKVGGSTEEAGVYRTFLPGSAVELLFLEHDRFYRREGLYGDQARGDYPDNPERFAFLCRAAFSVCRALGWTPEILHAHDWQAALAPVLLRHGEGTGEFAKEEKKRIIKRKKKRAI